MPIVKFTSNLKRFYPDLAPLQVEGQVMSEVLNEIEAKYAGLTHYIMNENGALREHVNIYIGNDLIKDREALSDPLVDQDEVYIMQAISGG